jgi:hypothetical protein
MLTVVPQGRHRYYRLAGPQVAELIEALARVAPAAPVRSLREGTRAHAIRTARTCYDHLAGRLGVALMQSLIAEGAVTGGDGLHHLDGADRLSAPGRDVDYRLSPAGAARLERLGIEAAADRPLRYCVDWTEQAHHLSGPLGARSPSACSSSAGSAAPTAAAPSTSPTPAPTACSASSASPCARRTTPAARE